MGFGKTSVEGLVMKDGFWKDRRVLITGHTGFKGSWLSLWLSAKGAQVTGYSLPPATQPNLFEAARIADGIESITGDVRELEHLESVIKEHQPEAIFHMAAQSLVRHSYENPLETYSTNVMGTINVLEAVRRTKTVKALINITSDKCYENNEQLRGYCEDDPMGGHDPYSSSKGCAELVTSAYRRSYFSDKPGAEGGVSISTTRAGNVIGGGDWAKDRLIPDIMNAIANGEKVLIRYPDAVRPWQHVLEPLRGYLMLARMQLLDGTKFASAWNFGPGDDDSHPVSWITERLTSLWGDGAGYILDNAEHPHEATYLKLDCSKAEGLLGWSPKLDLSTTLEWIVEWYKAFMKKEEMRRITLAQIERYDELADPSGSPTGEKA
jgi:CDP-glucose 4,6-dehydratase